MRTESQKFHPSIGHHHRRSFSGIPSRTIINELFEYIPYLSYMYEMDLCGNMKQYEVDFMTECREASSSRHPHITSHHQLDEVYETFDVNLYSTFMMDALEIILEETRVYWITKLI